MTDPTPLSDLIRRLLRPVPGAAHSGGLGNDEDRATETQFGERPAVGAEVRNVASTAARARSNIGNASLGVFGDQGGQGGELPMTGNRSNMTFVFNNDTPASNHQGGLVSNVIQGQSQARPVIERDWVTNVGVGNISLGRTVGSDSGTFPRSFTGLSPLFVDTSNPATFPPVATIHGTSLIKDQVIGGGSLIVDTMRSTGSSTIHESISSKDQIGVALSYSITILPATLKGMSSLCRNTFGSGQLVCIRRECKSVGHHRSLALDFTPGSVAILQSSGTIFKSPMTHRSRVPLTLLREWKAVRASAEEWISVFTAANEDRFMPPDEDQLLDSGDDTNVDADLAAEDMQEAEQQELKRLEESAKMKRKIGELMTFGQAIKVPAADYETRLAMEEDEEVPGPASLKRAMYSSPDFDVPGIIIRLEQEQVNQGKVFELLADMLDVKDDWIMQELSSVLQKATNLETVLGRLNQSKRFRNSKETVWGAISLLSEIIEEVETKAKVLPHEFTALRAQVEDALSKLEHRLQAMLGELGRSVEQRLEVTGVRLDVLERTAAEGNQNLVQVAIGSNRLKDEFEELQQLVYTRTTSFQDQEHRGPSMLEDLVVNLQSEFLEAVKKLGVVEGHVKKLLTGNDGEAIQFFNLGFNDVGSSDQWVGTHKPGYGYVVDVHLVFEHVFGQTSQEQVGTMDQLQQINKMKLTNLAQSLAIRSFEKRLPKYLMKPLDTGPSRSGRSDSHFIGIPDYTDWDKPLKGHRDRLREEVKVFNTTHMRTLDNAYTSETLTPQAYAIAKESVLTSTTWILEFINYIDDTYKEMLRHNTFSSSKAWELVTQLGRRVFMELSIPRIGVQNTFDVSDPLSMSQQIFWPTIKCQDIMKRYQQHSFKDDPTIASEYVKFLAANSGSDVFAKMEQRVGVLEAFGNAAHKEANTAKDKALGAYNKAEDVRRLMETLTKRVVKLENHK